MAAVADNNPPPGPHHLYNSLWAALESAVQSPEAVTKATVLMLDDSPRIPAGVKKRQPLSWCDSNGIPVIIQFPAILAPHLDGNKFGEYFNYPSGINDKKNLKKVKAIFELLPLPESPFHPEKAVRCSKLTVVLLRYLMQNTEQKRSKGSGATSETKVHEWIRAHDTDALNSFSFIVQTEPIFGDPNRSTVSFDKQITLDDIFGQDDDGFELLGLATPGRKRSTSGDATADDGLPFNKDHCGALIARHMPDPKDYYRNAFGNDNTFMDAPINVPLITDEKGQIIMPSVYHSTFPDSDSVVVVVRAELRLWDIDPSNRNGSNSEGSRTYQIVLKTMNLLPRADAPATRLLPTLPPTPSTPVRQNKRAAVEETEATATPSKKTSRPTNTLGSSSTDRMDV
ncbi:hypothetical protein CVT24_002643 [Panaeolus cyanescens]|uniref:Uncharacterized protein n=1 Tax=Panaeolus cyanescens TaxID=181874 RepID=A0A409WB69_9AGAR|nr:hypothetical protein CVT24_002643 [Panaeolus cyanescens]